MTRAACDLSTTDSGLSDVIRRTFKQQQQKTAGQTLYGFFFQGFHFQRYIMPMTWWCCIVRDSVVFLFSVDAPGESSKRTPQTKHLLFKSCSCCEARVCVCVVHGYTCIFAGYTFNISAHSFSVPPLFLPLTLSPGHILINGYHSQLISYSSFGNYIRILTTQTKRWGGEREQSKGKIN